MKCKDVCNKYPKCMKYKLVKNQKEFTGDVEICSEPEMKKTCNGTGEVASEPVEVCEWVNTMGFNESSCRKGNQIDFIDYEDFRYCPYCGKSIKIKE